ncbi:immunity protein YezG family protein [Chondrinema litorale]|uniref:immunity protein YezG family protein n=1 Tax=Chondrinema litorale TaxID=2994555 RepID=UPI0025426DE8|nr:immunity protein YezG family protein [Chondrinema litorale]UZR99398.1 DUF600 family protein [Chondrinema litorale]
MKKDSVDNIITELGYYLVKSVPTPNWDKIEVISEIITLTSQTSSVYFNGDSVIDFLGGNTNLIDKLKRLRAEMYKLSPNKGAWYTIKIIIFSSGDFDISYDYDNKPDFNYQPNDELYRLDFKEFPRDENSTPEWLKEILNKA